MLPDASLNDQDFREEVKPQASPVSPQEEEGLPAVTHTPGAKTPDNHMFAALKEEREKRQALEARLEALESYPQSSILPDTSEAYSDEGRMILAKLAERDAKIAALEEREKSRVLMAKYPSLQGREEEFDVYRKDFPAHKMEIAVKSFLHENGLIEATKPARKGLESSSAGPKTSEPQGFTAEEIDRIRSTQPRLFIKLIRDGAIDPDKIR